MALHDSYVQFAKDTQLLIETAAGTLGILDVFYGDQNRIPRTPAVCVEPGGKTRALNGLPRKTEVTLTVYVIVYHYQLTGLEAARENNDRLAEDLEEVLHADAQMKQGGMASVVDSMVTNIESGVMQKTNSLFRASRITFEARSQVLLPFSTP